MADVKSELLERELLAQPVRGLQYMLRRLSQVYDFLPEVTPNGKYDERTLESVMLFQRELHPPVTGVVDRGTWEAIYSQWQKAEQNISHPQTVRAFPAGGCKVEPGSSRDFMAVPQAMFMVLAHHFQGLSDAPVDGIHGPDTVQNVRWVQRAAGLQDTGVMNQQTWNILCRLYEVFIVQDSDTARPQYSGGWG